MTPAQIPDNEEQRLNALNSYNILDTIPEQEFEDITFIASQICQTPISLVSLIDKDRQWFKSNRGLDVTETHRDYAFCAHAILEPDKVLEVNDSFQDSRFADNPLVTSAPEVIFYTGVPLVTPNGFALGTLCVIDNKPRQLNKDQIKGLKALAGQVVARMELNRKVKELDVLTSELKENNAYLERFAVMAAHDIRNPLTSILLTSKVLKDRFAGMLDDKGNRFVDIINTSGQRLLSMLDKMLDYSRSHKILSQNKQEVDLQLLLDNAIKMVNVPDCFTINLPSPARLTTSVVAFEQIIVNLLTNAIRYNDKPQGIIDIVYNENDHFYTVSVTDNGIGIAPIHHQKIFSPMFTVGHADRFEKKGSGVGLNTVKSLVETLGGAITVTSEVGTFTTFVFTLKK